VKGQAGLFLSCQIVVSLFCKQSKTHRYGASAAGHVIGQSGTKRWRPLDRWTMVFLATTLLTSLTGFLFPIHGFTPAIGLGLIALPVLGLAIGLQLAAPWCKIYVITVVVARYLNFFVLMVQSFMKIPALHDLAPMQSDPPFAIAQGVALVAFVALGIFAKIKFRASTILSA